MKIRVGPSGIHLFNRETGLNFLLDEINPPSERWSKAPRQVSIALTNSCDLECTHCYAPKYRAVLPYEELLDWLKELDTNGCVGVGFGGGEPTLYPQFTELCKFAESNTNLAVTMTTHAHRLNSQLLSDLEGNIHFARVSMDGVRSNYEKIRGRSFSELLDRIRALSQITAFGINYVVNSTTIPDLDQAVNIASELGADEFLIIPEEPIRKGKGIDKETLKILRKWIETYSGTVPLAISEGRSHGLPTCDPFENEDSLLSFAHINASGVLQKTSYDSDGIEVGEKGVLNALEKLKSM